MNRHLLIILDLLLMWNEGINCYQFNSVHAINKRMDLESCLGQFDIHRNMIIRTEESLAIGGKYLQGIALETTEECRRLCCETDGCDVFIFEEKSEGYCYLFECGPPENFRCKFTKHGNFTSAVLTPIRHITPMPTPPPPPLPALVPIKQQSSPITSNIHSSHQLTQPQPPTVIISQQERELTNLKQKLETIKLSTTITATTTLLPPPNYTTPKVLVATISNCGRFQFQCHSGECIGIYNACNGIPQCEDGSDEGPECTDGNSSSGSTITKNDQSNNNHQPDEINISKQNMVQTLTRQQYQQPQILQVPIINNREDPMSAPQLWPNQQLTNTQDENSHIFNHKGGIQLPSGSASNIQQQYPNMLYNQMPNQRLTNGIYLQPNDLQNQYRQAILQQPQDNLILPPNVNWVAAPASPPLLPIQQQTILNGNNPYQLNNGQLQQPQSPSAIKITQETIDVQSNNNLQLNPVRNNEQNYKSLSAAATSSINNNFQSTNADKNTNINKKDSILANSKESAEEYNDYTEMSTERPLKKKGRKHKTTANATNTTMQKEFHSSDRVENALNTLYHGQYHLIKENLELEFTDHDGYSERPSGAVLSLTLGVLVAAALAILIGCRMRTVGRRVRRLGKTPMTGTDADFLVNGMYL